MTDLDTYLKWLKASGEAYELSDDRCSLTIRSVDNEGLYPESAVSIGFDLKGGYICTRPWRFEQRGQPLTKKQDELLRCWKGFYAAHGYWPTLREAGEALGVTKVSVYQRLQRLKEKGYMLAPEKKAARSRARSWVAL